MNFYYFVCVTNGTSPWNYRHCGSYETNTIIRMLQIYAVLPHLIYEYELYYM